MNKLFKILLCTPLLSTSLLASPLKSVDVKELICSRVESFVWDTTDINEKQCVKSATFNVTDKTYNPQIRKYSRLKVSFSYQENKVEVSGTVNAVRIIRFSETGELLTRWSLEDFKAELNDKRNYEDVFNEIFDNDGINVHNGDAGIYKVKPEHTEADLVKSLEESLENYGNPDTDREYDFCSYYNVTGAEDVIDYMKDHSSDLADLLKNMQEKGQIKGAAYRGFDEGASEYCYHYYFEILTNDNKVIYVNFDFTT